ncbi:hypothetical protein ACQ9BO_08910 [Flavobacterium sp. P21]|uniref:hypothetical protein n=1 Tax=Flavobacterium sp. P21 TaxID=3423948 RepID=UPI003D67BAD8
MIVASGFETGGHTPSFLASAEQSIIIGTFVVLRLIKEKVKIPIIARWGNCKWESSSLQP